MHAIDDRFRGSTGGASTDAVACPRKAAGRAKASRRASRFAVGLALLIAACAGEPTAAPPDTLPWLPATYDAGASGLLNVAAVDVVGDGHADLVVVAKSDLTIRIFPGIAGGAFDRALDLPAQSDAFQAAVGDVNGDGVPDLVVIGHDNAFNVRVGTGDGQFGEPTRYTLRNHGNRIVVTDLNHDGYADVVAAHDGSGQPIYVTAYLGSASGALQKIAEVATPYFTTHGIATGDFDGDGNSDVALATSDPRGAVLVFRSTGDGGLADPIALASVATGGGGDGTIAIAAGDLDGDGRDDIVTADYALTNQIVVRLATADGFAAPKTIALPSPISVALGDVDGDGTLDIAAANLDDGTVSLLRGRGDGTFDAPRTLTVGTGPAYVAVGDFDGDGRADLAVTDVFDGMVRVFRSGGATTRLSHGAIQDRLEPPSRRVPLIGPDRSDAPSTRRRSGR